MKKRRARMQAWAASPEGRTFLHRFRYRTPEDAEAIRVIQMNTMLPPIIDRDPGDEHQ